MQKPPTPISVYIDEVLRTRQFKTRKEIAAALGMKESTFSKSVQNDGTLTVEQCLRLAGVLGVSVAGILRLVGRHDLASLADDVVRPGVGLSRYERELIKEWRLTTETDRQAVFAVIRQLRRARSALSGTPRVAVPRSLARRLRADERALTVARERRRKKR